VQNPALLSHEKSKAGGDLLFLPGDDPLTEVYPERATVFAEAAHFVKHRNKVLKVLLDRILLPDFTSNE
jgi:hypothetical protein